MNQYHFLEHARVEPPKLSLDQRKQEFLEIYQSFSSNEAVNQASRCLDCGIPYCKWQCPVANHIPEWLKLVQSGNIIEAAELSHSTNSLPEICGRVCPQDRLCEGACTLNNDFDAVTIGSIEKYISDEAFSRGWRPQVSPLVIKSTHRVAIIGAGPAGLAAADVLIRSGIQVVVYDKYPEIGGLLSFGIPSFKLEKHIIKRRREIMESMGVKFILNTEIGKDISFTSIYEEYSAIFLGLGAYKAVEDTRLNTNLAGHYKALDFLLSQAYRDLELTTQKPYINLQGLRVLVLGGGDTAMDCTRTAIRQGAKSVLCAYRRNANDMKGSRREVQNSKDEGVEFLFNKQCIAINGDGAIQSVTLEDTVTGNQEDLAVDVVIVAYGFRAKSMDFLEDYGLEFDDEGRLLMGVELPHQTKNSKIFAGGDMVRGSDLVVTAVFEGRKAANSIKSYIKKL